MNWLYRILDVGYGVDLAVRDVQRLRTKASIGFALFLDGILLILLLWAWWTYDLYATWEWASPLGEGWGARLPEGLQAYNQWLIFLLNGLPTLIQWRFPSLARDHSAAFWAFLLAATFDLVTDFPAVERDVTAFLYPAFLSFGQTPADLLWWAAVIGGTIGASFVVQSLAVIHLAKVFALFGATGATEGLRDRYAPYFAPRPGYYDDERR